MPENTPSKPQDSPGSKKKVEVHSHVLHLADGSVRRYQADDTNPHAPLPLEVDGIPVVGAVHAYERSDNE
jgi:hypothetical protein